MQNLRAFTVSVGFDDLLGVSLPRNAPHFKEIVIVTTPADYATQLVVTALEKATCFRTDAFYDDGATFNKGRSLELALSVLSGKDWICHLDADIVLPAEMDLSGIEPGHLYVARRRLCLDPREYTGQTDWSHWPLIPEKDPFDCGAFQLFHADDPVLATRPWYPTHWKHAGGSDTEFNAKWPADKRHYLPLEVLHLGEPYRDWHGRQTPRLDGTVPEGAAHAREAMEGMYAARGKYGYKGEKLSQRR